MGAALFAPEAQHCQPIDCATVALYCLAFDWSSRRIVYHSTGTAFGLSNFDRCSGRYHSTRPMSHCLPFDKNSCRIVYHSTERGSHRLPFDGAAVASSTIRRSDRRIVYHSTGAAAVALSTIRRSGPCIVSSIRPGEFLTSTLPNVDKNICRIVDDLTSVNVG